MEIQIKKTVKAGNSSAVILPRAWLNREVRIELVKKTPDTILLETINILHNHIELKEVIGIYLAGSYARGDEDKDSDIDILVITSNTDKEMIHEGIYNFLIISKKLLKQKLEQNLFPIGQMLKEAKPLLNYEYLKSIKINVTRENIKWYLETTKDKLIMIEKIINELKNKNIKYVSDRVIYTLVLRIRTLYIIEKLIKNKSYSKKDFLGLIKKIAGTNVYESYLSVKNDVKRKDDISIDETEKLYKYLKKQLEIIKKMLP